MPKQGSLTSAGIGIYLTQLGSIDVHPAIPIKILANIEAITHKIYMADSLTPEGAQQFLLSHPIQCAPNYTAESFYCVSGLRSLQIARSIFKDTDNVPIMLHREHGAVSPAELATTDAYLTSMIFGLDDLCWDISIKNLLQSAVSEGMGLVKRKSDARMARGLAIDKRRLSKKYKRPESQVKKLAKPAPGNE